MKLEDFVNKTVVLELRDGSLVKGMLLEITTSYDDEEDEEEIRLSIRIDSDNYIIIDVNEIESIGELI